MAQIVKLLLNGTTTYPIVIPESVIFNENGEQKNLNDIVAAINAELEKLGGLIGEESASTQIADAIAGLDSSKKGEGTYVDVTVTLADGKVTGVAIDETALANALSNVAHVMEEDHTGLNTSFTGKFLAGTDLTLVAETLLNNDGWLKKQIDDINIGVTDVAEGTTNGAISVTLDGGTTKNVAVHGLGSMAYEDKANYATKDQGAAADTAVQDVTSESDLITFTKIADNTVTVDDSALSEQLTELSEQITNVGNAAKSYEIAKLTTEEVTALGDANVKEAYKLIDEENATVGEVIKIYKDSSLKEVKLDGQNLQFTYILADGSESTVPVDVSAFLAESEFGNGLQVVNHVVSVKKDTSSESFLSVSENGVKVSGIQDAISEAQAAATTTIAGKTTGHVTVSGATQTDGSIKYTIAENDIASDEEFQEHIKNTVIHITAAERTAWNAKVDYDAENIVAVDFEVDMSKVTV